MKKTVALLLILSLTVLFVGCDRNKKTYKTATKLMENEQYSEAADTFATLGEYEDSAEKILLCKYKNADMLLQDNKIFEAKSAFTELGDYSDSQQRLQQINEKYFFENFGYILPKFNVIRSDAECTKETKDSDPDDNHITDIYEYRFYCNAEGMEVLEEEYKEWMSLMNTVKGVSVSFEGGGLCSIEVYGDEIGLVLGVGPSIVLSIENDYL